ncbi:MAG: Rieske (2Fe-2S) protein [Chitinivibrionales bacterium]
MNKDSLSRREFFARAGKGAVAAAVIGPMIVTRLSASGKSVPVTMEPVSINLKDPAHADLAKVGGAKKFPNPLDPKKPIIVTRISETECAAFSSKCTHWGCEVSLPENNVIKCPCHKSTFDMSGKVTHGPAKKNLKAFSTKLEGDILTVGEQKA